MLEMTGYYEVVRYRKQRITHRMPLFYYQSRANCQFALLL